jgi:hypothetical protein
MKRIVQAVVLFAVLVAGASASPSFMLIPATGFVGGFAGSTIGWGYTINNDTPYYLLIDSSAFCGSGGDPLLVDCSTPYNGSTQFGPSLGTYTDFIATNLTIIAPNSTAQQSFDPILQQGVGQYTIDPGAPLFAIDLGHLFITYLEFDADPLNGGNVISEDIELAAQAEVQVQLVPEPATIGLAAGALLAMAVWSRRARPNRVG